MKLNLIGSNFEWMGNANSIAIHEDSLKVLKVLEDNSVDLIFADPPYGLGKDFGEQNPDSFFSAQHYFNWAKEWLDECMRVLKEDGTLYLMNSVQNMPLLDVYISERYHIINRIIWAYDSSGTQSKKKFGSLYEPILMITHSENSKYTFNSDAIMVETTTGAKRKLIDYRKTPPQPYNSKKVPGNVWNFNRVRFKMKEYENHPTQKPEALLERIILASSNKGDIVLDPFAGSFTTCAVAVANQRVAIGIESNEDYYRIGLRRTGITDIYKGETLTKDLSRKTNNKARIDHIEDFYQQLQKLDPAFKEIQSLEEVKALKVKFNQGKLPLVTVNPLLDEQQTQKLYRETFAMLERKFKNSTVTPASKSKTEVKKDPKKTISNEPSLLDLLDVEANERKAPQTGLPLSAVFEDLYVETDNLEPSPIISDCYQEEVLTKTESRAPKKDLATDLFTFINNARQRQRNFGKESYLNSEATSKTSDPRSTKELLNTFTRDLPKIPQSKNSATHASLNPIRTSDANTQEEARKLALYFFDKAQASFDEQNNLCLEGKSLSTYQIALELLKRINLQQSLTKTEKKSFFTAQALVARKEELEAQEREKNERTSSQVKNIDANTNTNTLATKAINTQPQLSSPVLESKNKDKTSGLTSPVVEASPQDISSPKTSPIKEQEYTFTSKAEAQAEKPQEKTRSRGRPPKDATLEANNNLFTSKFYLELAQIIDEESLKRALKSRNFVETPSGFRVYKDGIVLPPSRRGRRSEFEINFLIEVNSSKENLSPHDIDDRYQEALLAEQKRLANLQQQNPPKKRGPKSKLEKQALALAEAEGRPYQEVLDQLTKETQKLLPKVKANPRKKRAKRK